MEDKKTNGNLALNGREYRVIKIEARLSYLISYNPITLL